MSIYSPKLSEFNFDKEKVKFGCLVPSSISRKFKYKHLEGNIHGTKKLNAPATQ